MTPEDVRVEPSYGFLASALRGRRRVLEVGCGHGTVARRLGAMGFEVTALDRELRDPTPAPGVTFVERDFLDYTAPFDAIAFTTSLHHIAPLDRAIAKAAELLAPGGVLAVDDFAIEAPDAATLRWYYDAQELLVAAGLYPRDRLDAANDDLAARWHHAHSEHHVIHTSAQMRSAIAERFAIRDVRCVEYLHRYIGGGLSADERGGAIAAHIFASERRGIVDGVLTPVGLRIVATST